MFKNPKINIKRELSVGKKSYFVLGHPTNDDMSIKGTAYQQLINLMVYNRAPFVKKTNEIVIVKYFIPCFHFSNVFEFFATNEDIKPKTNEMTKSIDKK